jgi:5-formaminoimidazole-4-carboxamide-1-beta-D-ribofuranosyl 5'-monophosphate synthetase
VAGVDIERSQKFTVRSRKGVLLSHRGHTEVTQRSRRGHVKVKKAHRGHGWFINRSHKDHEEVTSGVEGDGWV